jgi:hypothetical protein
MLTEFRKLKNMEPTVVTGRSSPRFANSVINQQIRQNWPPPNLQSWIKFGKIHRLSTKITRFNTGRIFLGCRIGEHGFPFHKPFHGCWRQAHIDTVTNSSPLFVTEPPRGRVHRQDQIEGFSVKREHNQHT